MLVDVKVPQLSESVAEATLVSWHKKAGEFVKRDENLVDIETDKVVLETPAPQAGVLVKIVKTDGGTVTSNEIIAQIDTDAKADGKPGAQAAEAKAPECRRLLPQHLPSRRREKPPDRRPCLRRRKSPLKKISIPRRSAAPAAAAA